MTNNSKDNSGLLSRLFGRVHHNHKYVIDMGYTYCGECGSPFSSLSEAERIMDSKHKTKRLNELLSKRKLPQGFRRINGTEPKGLTTEEEIEFQILQEEHFRRY